MRQKNLGTLLAAWLGVAMRLRHVSLTLVGEGAPGDRTEAELRESLERNHALAESVTITGWVRDVTPHLEGADVYAFPSHHEGMSNSLLEAVHWDELSSPPTSPPTVRCSGTTIPFASRRTTSRPASVSCWRA